MTEIGQLPERQAPDVARLKTVARSLFWISVSWCFLMFLGVAGTVIVVMLKHPEGEDLSAVIRNGTYNLAFGSASVVICGGAFQATRTRSYAWSVIAFLLSCLPCVSPWFFIGIPFGIWGIVLLRKPEVKAAFVSAAGGSSPDAAASSRMLRMTCAIFGGIFAWLVGFNLIGACIAALLALLALELEPFDRFVMTLSHGMGILIGLCVARLIWPRSHPTEIVAAEVAEESAD